MEDRLHAARILMIDDDVQVLRVTQKLLQRSGYTSFRHTSDPHEALPLFRDFRPDLVLLDLQMPGMSGFEVMEGVQPFISPDEYLPILILTGDVSTRTKWRALSQGAKDFLHKPFDPIELFLRIRNHLQIRLLHARVREQNRELEARVEERTHELRRALAEAEAASVAKSNFLSIISHELRTPLAGIISHAELLEAGVAGELGETQREHAETIASSGWHLSHLLGEILDFAGKGQDAEEVSVERTDAGRVARAAAAQIAPLAGEKGLELRIVLPEERLEIHTDPVRVHRILFTLLANAVDFTESGTILLTVDGTGPDVAFHVSDTGIGIDPADLDRVWEPFWQAEDPLIRSRSGAGLGLSNARRQTLLLGGEITVRSTMGEGSTFTLSLPRRLHPSPSRTTVGAPRP